MADSTRMALAKEIASELRRREGRNLVAVGVFGSVAYGLERRHSDVDLLVVVRRPQKRAHFAIRQGVLVTFLQETPDGAREEVTAPNPNLPEILSGWRNMKPLYDPTRLLRRLTVRARHVPASQFRRAAREGLLGTYEDLGKLRDAVEARDRKKMREMAIWFTGGTAAILLCLARHPVPSGQDLFVEVQRLGRAGKAIGSLRYRNLGISATSRLAERIWSDLLRRARLQAIAVTGLG